MMNELLDYRGLSAYNDKLRDLFTVTTTKVITVPVVEWNNLNNEIVDGFFLASDKYSYLFAPTKESKNDYRSFGIDPVEITNDYKLILSAKKQPTVDIIIEVLRLEA